MGIYIKGIEMPTSCYACMFFAQTNHWNKEDEADILSHCKRTGEKTWESVNGFLPNCPLVPVPDNVDAIFSTNYTETITTGENREKTEENCGY